jgi:alkylation response protein AidB-like acyl-CoA dehydrogenase
MSARPEEEIREIREAVRRYAAEQLAPNAARWDRDKEFPREALKGLAAMGLYAVAVAEDWGGAGLGYGALAVACEEIAAGDCATATIVAVNNLVAGILAGYGSDQQKNRFLRPLAKGELLGAFALTEPQVGSDASAITTRAERQGGHYVLNGVKQFITSGKSADLAVVFAVTAKEAGKRGISAFVVPTDTAGYVVARIEEKTGQRASDTAQIVLENCKVPAENRLAEEGVGYRIALANLETGRINVAAQATGVARAALEAALAYARQRRSMGKALIEHQAINFRLADMATGIEAARRLYLHAASLRDAGTPCIKEASMAKLFASEMAERVCSDAIQIHGGYGYVADFPVERLWRDVRVTQIYEGASDIQRLVIGRTLAEGA